MIKFFSLINCIIYQ